MKKKKNDKYSNGRCLVNTLRIILPNDLISSSEGIVMKIMVTGYPTLQNAITSLNLGADAYVLKPVSPKELLKIVEEKLTEQSRIEMLSEDQVADWIKTRLEKLK